MNDFAALESAPASLPVPARGQDVQRGFEAWQQRAARTDDASLASFMAACGRHEGAHALLAAIFGHSPYLTHLALAHAQTLRTLAREGADAAGAEIFAAPASADARTDTPALMQRLRGAKARMALLTASADLLGWWKLEAVTAALSRLADSALQLSVRHLLAQAAARQEITLPNASAPEAESGIVILGMGKLGAYELNYSSDIDLIIFYEPGRLQYTGRHTEQKFYTKFAHDLVQLMQERTADGYVFRTDLRLRPDPASTPPAVSTTAALYYYESVGQNWERAAMIKARPVAGDLRAGEAFLEAIAPFMWRRSLDFASIQDIHSIKRQMDTREGRSIVVPGHNIKLGLGGIREIEFFVQIHQLIWGGRRRELRTRGTCETLAHLAQEGLIDEAVHATLASSYRFLRTLEHRLQMVADQQTHSLPQDAEELRAIALFTGFQDVNAFSETLLGHLHAVHGIFASSFKSSENLGDVGNLVFTGVTHDPDTLATLAQMGYRSPAAVSETVMGWHHGSRRCTRTRRARELLTELMPVLLKRLSETADPDAAFLNFDEFLARMPAGVQLFSLFANNPQLLTLIADIMGSAPALAETLSRHPDLLDSVLLSSFYDTLPGEGILAKELQEWLRGARHFEERMETLSRFRNEKQFQAGVQLLKKLTHARHTGPWLATLAEVILSQALCAVTEEFERAYGRIPRGRFAVIGLGRLGSREMTFGSDIDLIFVYDAPDGTLVSDGEKGFAASAYYNRLAQRLLGALTATGREGRLYEVDARLRPSGEQGLIAVSAQAMRQYFGTQAWTFEFMALTRARVVAGDPALAQELAAFINTQLHKPRDAEALRRDVADMRGRVAREFSPDNPWDLKYAKGGLMDLDFLCQHLLLLHAHAHPQLSGGGSAHILAQLAEEQLIPAAAAAELREAEQFLTQLHNIMRLSLHDTTDVERAQPGLKKLLCDAAGAENFAALKAQLAEVEKQVHNAYSETLTPPKEDL